MKLILLAISGIILSSGVSFAKSVEDNPFLPPSKRIPEVKMDYQTVSVESNEALIKEMAEQIAKDKIKEDPPHLQPEVLGSWTKEEVLESNYIGDTNNVKIYFNERLKRYIYLDMSNLKKALK